MGLRNGYLLRNHHDIVSGKSEYRTASDGLPARVSGPWAEDKLEALAGYSRIVCVP